MEVHGEGQGLSGRSAAKTDEGPKHYFIVIVAPVNTPTTFALLAAFARHIHSQFLKQKRINVRLLGHAVFQRGPHAVPGGGGGAQ